MHVAIIANYPWVGISSPLINTIGFLIDKGYFIDLYLERPDFNRFPLPGFIIDNVNLIVRGTNGQGKAYSRSSTNRVTRKIKYNVVMAFDHRALFEAMKMKLFHGALLVYYNLEFFIPQRLSDYENKLKEIAGACFSKYIITQDPLRASWLSTSLSARPGKFRVICNSSRGLVASGDSKYFRNKFTIRSEQKIVLCVGSMIREHYVEKIVASALTWDDGFVLVLHGWFPDAELRHSITKMQGLSPGKIFISDHIFDDSEKFTPFLSCDIGFVGFYGESPNMKFAGASAGKIFDFIKTRKPILFYETDGMSIFTDIHRVGVSFNNDGEIIKSLDILASNSSYFSDNCAAAFEFFEYDRNFGRFWDEVIGISSQDIGYVTSCRGVTIV